MTLKRLCIVGSSSAPTYVSDDFSLEKQDINFIKHLDDCQLIAIHEGHFYKFEFLNFFDKARLRIFIYNQHGEIFLKLVKMF